MLLADDALSRRSAAWNIFHGDDLPKGLGAEEVEEHLSGVGVVAESPRTA